VEETQEEVLLPKKRKRRRDEEVVAETQGIRPRALITTESGTTCFGPAVPVEGGSSGDWFGVSKKRHPRAFPERELETRMGILEKLIKRMAQYYYAKERDGIGWRWQKRDGFQEELRRPFGRRENRQESNR
jgi:hypothetical protein